MVDEQLKAEGTRIGEEGWKWVAVAVDFPYDYDEGMRVIDGEQPLLTENQEAKLASLGEEADRLETEWSGSSEVPDEVDARVTAIDEEISAIVSRPLVYNAQEMARAGAFVSIDSDGSLYIERGFVRPEDEPAEEPSADADDIGEGDTFPQGDDGIDAGPVIVDADGAPATEAADDEEEQDDMLRPLPDRLVTELTTHRTLALRNAVASNPQVAFAAVLHAITLDTTIRGGSLGVHAPGLNDSASAREIERRHETWAERLPDQPEELWDVLIALSTDEQAALFAHCASFGINAIWEPANRYNDGRVSARAVAGRIAQSHVLARAAHLDMVAAGWTAMVDNYLGRVTKARILAAVGEGMGAEVSARLAGLKKSDMAKEAERLLDGSGWLAEPLRTPAPERVEEPAVINGEPAMDADVPAEHDGAEAEEPLAVAAE
jgi:ParB family chromosome partitioning protein